MYHQSILNQPCWRIIENSMYAPADDALASFAVDDVLCESIGTKKAPATARSWVHTNTIVLGIQDARLPHVHNACDFLKANGWRVIVRNSGGLAVVLDKGIFNLSLILNEKQNQLTIDKAYQTMVELIEEMLSPLGIHFVSGEIEGSYCPGRYDLSVNGLKFAGISQRRIRGGVSTQVYICTDGSGADRAELVKTFYDMAGNEGTNHFPNIRPETMASLSELTGTSVTPSILNDQLERALSHFGKQIYKDLDDDEVVLFDNHYSKIQARNKKAFG